MTVLELAKALAEWMKLDQTVANLPIVVYDNYGDGYATTRSIERINVVSIKDMRGHLMYYTDDMHQTEDLQAIGGNVSANNEEVLQLRYNRILGEEIAA